MGYEDAIYYTFLIVKLGYEYDVVNVLYCMKLHLRDLEKVVNVRYKVANVRYNTKKQVSIMQSFQDFEGLFF